MTARSRRYGRIDWFDTLVMGGISAMVVGVLGTLGYVIYYEINDPGHGKVTSKQWEGAYYSTSCNGNVCSTSYTPECYRITYNDGHHPGDACVAPEEFDYYEVGSYYPKGWKP